MKRNSKLRLFWRGTRKRLVPKVNSNDISCQMMIQRPLLTSNKKKTRRQLFEAHDPLATVCSTQENQDGSGADGGSQFGGLHLPSVVQRLLGVFSGVETGLKLK